jgi:hypothetical protein
MRIERALLNGAEHAIKVIAQTRFGLFTIPNHH